MGETAKGTSGWTVETLFVHFTALLEEEKKNYKTQLESAERNNNQRFADQEKAVQAALAAAEKAVKAALDAAQKAVDKAEAGLVVWKESQNEWRGTIADIISKTAGKSSGLDTGWKILLGALLLATAIVSLYFKSR